MCSWSLLSTDQDLSISLGFHSDIFGSSDFSFNCQKGEGKNFRVVVFNSPCLLTSWDTSQANTVLVLRRFLARLGRQNMEPCGQVWRMQVCPGTRLSHEDSDRSYTQTKMIHYPPTTSVLRPGSVSPASDLENAPGQPCPSVALAVGPRCLLWTNRPPKGFVYTPESGFRVLGPEAVSGRVTHAFVSASLQ